MMRRTWIRRATAVALVGLTSGCGYRVLGGGSLAAEHSAIEIQMFENDSTEPGLERLFAAAISEEFVRRDWIEPRWVAEDTGLELAGSIREVRVVSSGVSSVALSVEDSVQVTFDVAVRRQDGGGVVYRHPNFVMTESFRTSPDPNTYETRKEQALRRLSARVAERIHDELFQQF